MATEVEDPEYVSDAEESPLPITMRRREASDDEEGNGEDRPRHDPRVRVHSDGESDGQGGVQTYEDEESEVEEEEEEVEDEVEEEFEERVAESGMHVRDAEVKTAGAGVELELNGNRSGDECGEGQNQDKKENEPFSVPTAGAFYMHDDRFREKGGGGRHRRTPGGSKLWESKDDRAWVHDRFEEMNLQDKYYDEERRTRKGHFRGRGKSRGQDRGYIRGNRSRGSDENGNQNRGPKGPRGRGTRRYGLPQQNNNAPPPSQRNQFLKNPETTSTNNSGRTAAHTSSEHPEAFAPRKNVFASSLNSASPPFYPSRSSGQDISATQKRDSQSASANKRISSYGPMEDNLSSTSHSNALLRGKTVVDTDGLDRSYVDDSFHSVSGKPLANLKPINTTLSSQNRLQGGRNLTSSAPLSFQPASSHNQAGRGFAQTQLSAVSQRPAQPALRSSSQQLGQRLASGNQTSSPQGPSTTSSEVGDVESPPGSYKSKMSSAGKGKVGGIQGSGIAPFLYSGAQVTGASGTMGVAHGDQSMSGTPALLQVMQFGGQHHGGLGVPAVGMALPGYVAQPQLGFGNSEMTWLPMLAGAAAGALGAAYCSPYIALDGGYYGRPSGQPSSASVSNRETTSSKSNENVLKASQRPELVNDECGQRQNKPRRYSEMNFNQ